MKPARVLSVGYERRSVEELVDLLAEHDVGKLLDVRQAPVSRRKAFNQRALAQVLARAGIEYLHLRAAGNPYRKERASIERCLELYQSYLDEHPDVLDVVAAELAKGHNGPVAFLCYEREHHCCHRSVLLNALVHQGHKLEVVRVE